MGDQETDDAFDEASEVISSATRTTARFGRALGLRATEALVRPSEKVSEVERKYGILIFKFGILAAAFKGAMWAGARINPNWEAFLPWIVTITLVFLMVTFSFFSHAEHLEAQLSVERDERRRESSIDALKLMTANGMLLRAELMETAQRWRDDLSIDRERDLKWLQTRAEIQYWCAVAMPATLKAAGNEISSEYEMATRLMIIPDGKFPQSLSEVLAFMDPRVGALEILMKNKGWLA